MRNQRNTRRGWPVPRVERLEGRECPAVVNPTPVGSAGAQLLAPTAAVEPATTPSNFNNPFGQPVAANQVGDSFPQNSGDNVSAVVRDRVEANVARDARLQINNNPQALSVTRFIPVVTSALDLNVPDSTETAPVRPPITVGDLRVSTNRLGGSQAVELNVDPVPIDERPEPERVPAPQLELPQEAEADAPPRLDDQPIEKSPPERTPPPRMTDDVSPPVEQGVSPGEVELVPAPSVEESQDAVFVPTMALADDVSDAWWTGGSLLGAAALPLVGSWSLSRRGRRVPAQPGLEDDELDAVFTQLPLHSSV